MCGVGALVDIRGRASHELVSNALAMLARLAHRGAAGADPETGDGAGVLVQIPDALLRAAMTLPAPGQYAAGMLFLPRDPEARAAIETAIEKVLVRTGLPLLGWRDVPVDESVLGPIARATAPAPRQLAVARPPADDMQTFRRRLFLARHRLERLDLHVASFSETTLVYKGLHLPGQLPHFYRDLRSPQLASAFAIVHSRFSTNTFPAWSLAHPFRLLSHNGEINTIHGNRLWLKAREREWAAAIVGDANASDALPLLDAASSDSAALDSALEAMTLGGTPLLDALLLMMPEAWEKNPELPADVHAFYEHHAPLIAAWDGPAAVCATDGDVFAARLDRNGLRPFRYLVTADEQLVIASEAGALTVPAHTVVERGRLGPGGMLGVDLRQGRLLREDEIKREAASRRPYVRMVEEARGTLPLVHDTPPAGRHLAARQRYFGLTAETEELVLRTMADSGEEPVNSMGSDTPPAILSHAPRPLAHYFSQTFAQVTNPPIDPLREELVTSLRVVIGSEHRITLDSPVITREILTALRSLEEPALPTIELALTFPTSGGAAAMTRALDGLRLQAETAVRCGVRLLILSDRGVHPTLAAVPSLLAVSSLHHHLARIGLRARTSIVVETGEAFDVHHIAALLGYGAQAVCPYLAFESLERLSEREDLAVARHTAAANFRKSIDKGLLKVMAKMGISTITSYTGAQTFEALGLSDPLVDEHFPGTVSRLGGIDLEDLATETLARHAAAFDPTSDELPRGGFVHYRVEGETHAWSPDTIALLQHATREGDFPTFQRFSELADRAGPTATALRHLLEITPSSSQIPVGDVEQATELVKRFTTGAMSLGAISPESHAALALAMNALGAKSNTGEGGEDPSRFAPCDDGRSASSAIKQIASGRFGVTAHYLVNARELQIKMAQGAKPGEGGQLPGHKVDATIARLRHSVPGIGLISPPPHHDIYSIEDLKQLILDLKRVNPVAAVSVKLVAKAGVGTIAAGVVKAGADKVLISGDSGGTGASALSSIKHAGLPWEIGLAETHQTLVASQLRDRVRLETDGLLRTGRDVVLAALLGADEFGFATAPLVVQGCVMMRKCHLNTCPVGIATQDPTLRSRFAGQPEHLVRYFFFVAEEVRLLLASLGARSLAEIIGRTDLLRQRPAPAGTKAAKLDLTPLLHRPPVEHDVRFVPVETPPMSTLDHHLEKACEPAFANGERVHVSSRVGTGDLAVGTRVSGRVVRRFGSVGLPADTIRIDCYGSAGQSFGAFLAPGVSLVLAGEANDYVGKGLSGGRVVVRPDPTDQAARPSVLIGNTAMYGATRGEAFISGAAGERFAVRNSGATAVVEGLGDHGCEYMTGGLVVVLGPVGRNFAAGMSGGIAYVLDRDGILDERVNRELVEVSRASDASPAELEALHDLLSRHHRYTHSPLAERCLADWPATRELLVKIAPKNYERALRAARAAAGEIATHDA